MNCSLYVDSILEQSNASTQNSTATTMTRTLSQGQHSWQISCTDLANNTNVSVSRNFTVDTSAPLIILNLPADSATLYSTGSSFNFTATDNLAPVLNCTFYLDGSPSLTNASVINDTLTNFLAIGLSGGAHNWSVLCSDGINIGASPVRNFFVDILAPTITLNSPNQSAVLNSSSVAFNFTATDNHAAALDCDIYVDSVLRGSNSSVLSGSSSVFTVGSIADGNHTWFVNCSDGGNTNVSNTRNFTVDTVIQQPPDDDDEDRPLAVSALSACNSTIVSAKSHGSGVPNAEIRIDGLSIGMTNSSGQAEFDDCGKTVEVRASKAGYSTDTAIISLIDCASCEVKPPKPPQNATCDCGEVVNGTCVHFGCCSDESCKGDERCDIPSGKAGGQCRPITGDCGVAANHAFVPYGYECGSEPGCPSCPLNERCDAHSCTSNDLKGPATGIVGTNGTIEAFEDGFPCALCDVSITDPLGNPLSGKTDSSGRFSIPLMMKGRYNVTLLRDGIPVRSISIDAIPKSQSEEPVKPSIVQEEDRSWLACLSALLLLALAIYLWRRRKKKDGEAPGASSGAVGGGKAAGAKKQ